MKFPVYDNKNEVMGYYLITSNAPDALLQINGVASELNKKFDGKWYAHLEDRMGFIFKANPNWRNYTLLSINGEERNGEFYLKWIYGKDDCFVYMHLPR